MAHALAELPLLSEAFSRGEVSYSKVRAIVRVATPESEATLLAWARAGTAEHLERICRARRQVSAAEAQDTHARRTLSWFEDDDGSLVIRGRLSPEDGALFVAAVDAAMDVASPPGERDSAESPAPVQPLAARRADALVRLAETTLAGDSAESSPGSERHQVVVQVDARHPRHRRRTALPPRARARPGARDGPAPGL